jgi:hypothetical protein
MPQAGVVAPVGGAPFCGALGGEPCDGFQMVAQKMPFAFRGTRFRMRVRDAPVVGFSDTAPRY